MKVLRPEVQACLKSGRPGKHGITDLMDDMMLSCGEYAEEASVALAPLMASSFSLGQMLGPLVGSASSGARGRGGRL